MPFAFQTDEENQLTDPSQQSTQTSSDPSQPQTLSGGTGGQVGATAGGAAAPGKTPSSSNSFTNLQSYLNANSDGSLGSNLSGKLQGNIDDATKQEGNTSNQFKDQVDQNTTKYNPDLVNSAISDPSNFVSDPSKINAFATQRDAAYKGPSSLTDTSDLYNNAYGSVQNASQNAQNAQTDGGKQALLQQYYGRPDYGSGQQSLDMSLLNSNPSTTSKFSNIADQATQLKSGWNDYMNGLGKYATQGATDTKTAHDNTRSALGIDDSGKILDATPTSTGAIQGLENNVNSAVTAGNTAAASNYAAAKNDLTTGHLTQDDIKNLKLQSLLGQSTYNTDPTQSQYLQQAGTATANNVATSDQYARMNALAQLANTQNTFLTGNPSQAGSYNPNAVFNTGAYQNSLNQAQQAYQNSLNSSTVGQLGAQTNLDLGNYSNPANNAMTANQLSAWNANSIAHPILNGLYDDAANSRKSQTALQNILDAYATKQGANTKFGG
jgi:hypothetical protein